MESTSKMKALSASRFLSSNTRETASAFSGSHPSPQIVSVGYSMTPPSAMTSAVFSMISSIAISSIHWTQSRLEMDDSFLIYLRCGSRVTKYVHFNLISQIIFYELT